MNAAPASARRLGIGVVVVVAALALTGCAAGQHAPTAEAIPVVDGVSADVGPIALRAVTVAAPDAGSYPNGGDAPLQLVIVNDGRTADKLVGMRTDKANEVRIFADAADASSAAVTPSSEPPASSSEPPASSESASPTGSESATPGESASASSSASVPPAPATVDSIDLPIGQAVSIGYAPDLPVIQLHGLTSALFPSESFPITFQFEAAGSVTFTIAVHLVPGPSTTPTVNISPTAPA